MSLLNSRSNFLMELRMALKVCESKSEISSMSVCIGAIEEVEH